MCRCGKVRHPSRRVARATIRRLYPGQRGMREYRCGWSWHVGHLPPVVIAGDKTVDEVYRRPQTRPLRAETA